MTTGFFTITAVALAAALSACAASAPSPQLQGSGSSVRAGDCAYDQDIFDTPDAMKLPKTAFCSPPQARAAPPPTSSSMARTNAPVVTGSTVAALSSR